MIRDDSGLNEALEEVSFPTPRADCIAAVLAVREYICTTNGATKEDIVNSLVPEDNYPIGHNAAAARCKLGGYDEFREWWWQHIVKPGLLAIPDIQEPTRGASTWRPLKR